MMIPCLLYGETLEFSTVSVEFRHFFLAAGFLPHISRAFSKSLAALDNDRPFVKI